MIATWQKRPLPSGDKENRNRPPETREHAQSNKPGRWTNLFTLQSARDNEPRGTGSRVSGLEASEIHKSSQREEEKIVRKTLTYLVDHDTLIRF